MKKMIAFDLDDTLAVTKNPITSEVAQLLSQLAGLYEVCVITGGTYQQMQENVISHLHMSSGHLRRMHCLSVNGGRYHYFDVNTGRWEEKRHAEDLGAEDKRRISEALKRTAEKLGYWESNPAGPIIADRGSQITYSALGQLATPNDKYAWDPDYTKRQKLYTLVRKALPGFDVKINGNTSLDITMPGIDKGFGIEKLRGKLGLDRDEILFIGDQLQEGGNDYPVKALGIDTINVQNVRQTIYVIEGLIKAKYKKGVPPFGTAEKLPEGLERTLSSLITLQVVSNEDLKRQVTALLHDHEPELIDSHNTTSAIVKFTVGGMRYGLKIEYGNATPLRNEARWYELVPADVKPHFVISHVSDSYTFVLLRWLERAKTLEEVAIANEHLKTQQTMDLVINALDQDRELFYSNSIVPLFATPRSSFFLDKYHAYNSSAKQFPYLQELLERGTVVVNDKELLGPYRYVQTVQQDRKLRSYLSPDTAGLIHGDTHADNLLVQDNTVYLIDPKGDNHLPLEYDTGRIFWSLNGWNAIIRGEFELNAHDGGYSLKLTRRQQYLDGLSRFRAYLGERGYHRAVYSAAMQYLTRIHHATEESETTALYLRGLQVFDELFTELEVKV